MWVHVKCQKKTFWFRLETVSGKVEKILKGSLDLIPSPSPSVKIQIMGGTAEGEGDGIESKLPFKIFPTLPTLQKGDLFS